MKGETYNEKIAWLRQWSKETKNEYFDVLDMHLWRDFSDRFSRNPLKCSGKNVSRFLSEAYKKGDLKRVPMGLSSGYTYSPKWVYSYEFAKPEQ